MGDAPQLASLPNLNSVDFNLNSVDFSSAYINDAFRCDEEEHLSRESACISRHNCHRSFAYTGCSIASAHRASRSGPASVLLAGHDPQDVHFPCQLQERRKW